MQVQDAVHGYITLNELEEQILDTPQMQRLRRVKQLGFSSLVYPSATHTRFEHSLGALHLADTFADSLQLGVGRAQELRLAALLHDVGHGPFSHTMEPIFSEHNVDHEHFSKQKIRDSDISDLLQDHGIHPSRITSLIDGDGRLGSIIAGHIDVDRMDYLMRDAYYTGVAYGTIDAGTIIRAARIHNERLVFDGKYLNALESLFTARYLMLPTVYAHRTSRIATRMFHEAFQLLQKEDPLAPEELTEMDDIEIRSRLRHSEASAPLMNRIDNRELYKIAASFDNPDLDRADLEAAVRDNVDIADEYVLADRIMLDDVKAYDVPLLIDGTVKILESVSTLPAALKSGLEQHGTVRIYAPEQYCGAVKEAANAAIRQ